MASRALRRGEAAFAAAVVLIGAAIWGLGSHVGRAPEASPGRAVPFISAAWYCPSPPSGEGSSAISTTNFGETPVQIRQWALAGTEPPGGADSEIPPSTRHATPLGDLGEGAAGVVESFGADTFSDVSVNADAGVADGRCSPQPWSKWYFAAASTSRGHGNTLLVVNPFDEEALIRVRTFGPEADAVPARLRDLVVPALSQLNVFLPDYIAETPSFGLEVAATRGRVVVSRFMRVATRDGLRAYDLTLGARGPATTWHFAGGTVPQDGEEQLLLVNPGEREALVQVVFPLEKDQLAPAGLQEVAVPAGRQVTIPLSAHLPRGAPHGTSVISTNAVSIVAERQTVSRVGDARVLETVAGAPGAGERWAVSAGSAVGGTETLALVNSGASEAVVSIVLLTDAGAVRPPETAAVGIAPGRRLTLDMSGHLAGKQATVLVVSDGPIAVERRLTLDGSVDDSSAAPGRLLN